MKFIKSLHILFVFVCSPFFNSLVAQCLNYPVSLQERVQAAATIVQGTVVEKVCYTDKQTGNIYTRNTIKAGAWLKGFSSTKQLAVITLGGVDGNRAMHVEPSLQLDLNKEYVLMLEPEITSREIKDPSQPNLIQLLPYADAQGALVSEGFIYHDLLSEAPMSEAMLFEKIEALTKTRAVTNNGLAFITREPLQKSYSTEAVTVFSPSPTNSGTIVPGEYLTITGTGFGAARGTGFVAFSNADNGGSTTDIVPPNASDYVSWSNTSITVKVPRRAGTGNFFVRDNLGVDHPSSSALTVNYAHINIDQAFLNFTEPTRQRYYLRNLNTLGGYTFTYNTTFNSNSPAVASFQRAINTWRCATGFNIRMAATTSAISTALNDGVSIVSFDATLPAGTLARATSRFGRDGITGVCDLSNTVWYAFELDIVFNDPPFTGFTWQYGPAGPTSSQFDFESVSVHELGHLHGLGHIIAPGLVMHYSLTNGASVRTLAARDINAGNAKMSYSTAATCFNPAGSGTPMVAVPLGSCSTLPVTLTKFDAKRINNTTNEINWQTTQELNNDGFHIERSKNGSSFETIGFVKGKELSFTQESYSFTDQSAGPFGWYYRLAQKDINGSVKYTAVVFVKGSDTKNWKVWVNTGSSVLFVYTGKQLTKPAALLLYNSSGQTVFSSPINSSAESFTLHLLSKGIYTYRIIADDEVVTGKVAVTD